MWVFKAFSIYFRNNKTLKTVADMLKKVSGLPRIYLGKGIISPLLLWRCAPSGGVETASYFRPRPMLSASGARFYLTMDHPGVWVLG